MISMLFQRILFATSISVLSLNAIADDKQPADLESLGTATVAETLAALKEDPLRVFVDHGGWLVGEKSIDGGSELWSFTPKDHEAYPAAVQRLITDGEDSLAIAMNIQCDAPTAACESLLELFTVMNENLIAVSKNAPPIREPEVEKAQ